MTKSRLACMVGLCVLLPGLGGCGQNQKGPGSGSTLTIAVIPKSTGEDFWGSVREGARSAAADLGVEIKWEGPVVETEIAEQNRIIENMVNLGVDGMALAPLNQKASRKPVETTVQAGIPVVIFDSEVDGDAHTSFVATNNEKGGRLGAEHLAQLLGSKGDVVCMRFIQGTGSTEARAKGFIEAAKAAGMKVVADPYADEATVAGCKKTAANTLEGFVKDGKLALDGVFACNDRSTLGMLAALEDLRKSGVQMRLKFVGFDFSPRMVDAVQDGTMDALVVQNPRKMGYLAVETVVKHIRGEKVPPYIDTGVEVVTKERLEKEPEIRKLVGAEK